MRVPTIVRANIVTDEGMPDQQEWLVEAVVGRGEYYHFGNSTDRMVRITLIRETAGTLPDSEFDVDSEYDAMQTLQRTDMVRFAGPTTNLLWGQVPAHVKFWEDGTGEEYKVQELILRELSDTVGREIVGSLAVGMDRPTICYLDCYLGSGQMEQMLRVMYALAKAAYAIGGP